MGFLKEIGKIAGSIAGVVVSAPVYLAGEVVNSDALREIANGAYKVTERTGELLGSATEGVAEAIYGTVTSDGDMYSDGINKVFDSGGAYIEGVGKGIAKMATNGLETVEAILDGDTDTAIKAGKEIVKTVAVCTLAIGVADVLDGVINGLDDADDGLLIADNDDFIENPNLHHVTPHERLLPDGSTIWVDGDGDTSVDTYDGWYQSNPDYKA